MLLRVAVLAHLIVPPGCIGSAGRELDGSVAPGAGGAACATREVCSGTTTNFCHNEYPYFLQGLVLMSGSALVGAIMAYQPDRAEVRAVNRP